MTDIEKDITEQIVKLIPSYEKLEIRGNISDSSYSVEFFVTVKGKRMQCYDMVDEGLIREKDLDNILETIARFFRRTTEYQKGRVNKISIKLPA